MSREFHDPMQSVASIGPFERWPVTVNGWSVPHLQARIRRDGEQVTLTCDNRLEIDIPPDVAGRVISFIADCIAVAKGYSCHPRVDGWDVEFGECPAGPVWPWRHMVGLTPEEADDLTGGS